MVSFIVFVFVIIVNIGLGFDCLGVVLGLYNYVMVIDLMDLEVDLLIEVRGRDGEKISIIKDNLFY